MRLIFIIFSLFATLFFCCTEQDMHESHSLLNITQDSLQIGDIIKCPKISQRIGGGNLNNSSKDSVRVVADIIKNNPDFIFEISSHTDHRGGSSFNLELSERHANFLRMYLINEHGIIPERITAKGYGDSNPIIPIDEIENSNDEAKERLYSINRRYELKVIGKIE